MKTLHCSEEEEERYHQWTVDRSRYLFVVWSEVGIYSSFGVKSVFIIVFEFGI